MKKRREMIESGIPCTNIEYAEIGKTMRKLCRDDVTEYNTVRVNKAVETGKSLRKPTNEEECTVVIPSLKEEDEGITINRERILKRCAEFYQKIYKDMVQNVAKTETEEVPSMLTSEVGRALSQMKSSNAPGGYQIVVEIIRAGGRDSSEKDSGDFKCSAKNRNSA